MKLSNISRFLSRKSSLVSQPEVDITDVEVLTEEEERCIQSAREMDSDRATRILRLDEIAFKLKDQGFQVDEIKGALFAIRNDRTKESYWESEFLKRSVEDPILNQYEDEFIGGMVNR